MCATRIEVHWGGRCTVLSSFSHWWPFLFLKLSRDVSPEKVVSYLWPQWCPVTGFPKICLDNVWTVVVRSVLKGLIHSGKTYSFYWDIFPISLCTTQVNCLCLLLQFISHFSWMVKFSLTFYWFHPLVFFN